MNTRLLIIIIACLVILPILVFLYVRFTNKPVTKTLPATTKFQQTVKKSTPAPTSSPISKPVAVEITTSRGIISTLSPNSLSIKTKVGAETFLLSGTKDFQKLVSGTIEKGDAKTVASSINELKAGQEILIFHNINSKDARSVYIIK